MVIRVAVDVAALADLGREFDYLVPEKFDQVTARAVSAFSKLIPLCAPLLRAGGEMVLMKGAGAEREIAAAEKAIRKFGLHDVSVQELGQDYYVEPTRVIRAIVS